MKLIISVEVCLMLLVGCATPPEEIQTVHVSPLEYSNYDCDQIAMEMKHVGRRVHELYSDLEDEADADETQAALGLILFWPALFFLEGGDDVRAEEYARIKGERLALEDAAAIKKCDSAMLPKFEEPKPREKPVEKQQTPMG